MCLKSSWFSRKIASETNKFYENTVHLRRGHKANKEHKRGVHHPFESAIVHSFELVEEFPSDFCVQYARIHVFPGYCDSRPNSFMPQMHAIKHKI